MKPASLLEVLRGKTCVGREQLGGSGRKRCKMPNPRTDAARVRRVQRSSRLGFFVLFLTSHSDFNQSGGWKAVSCLSRRFLGWASKWGSCPSEEGSGRPPPFISGLATCWRTWAVLAHIQNSSGKITDIVVCTRVCGCLHGKSALPLALKESWPPLKLLRAFAASSESGLNLAECD